MERDTKRSTSFIKRSEFENARKLLFGTEIIPGTRRERWTTAGLLTVKYLTEIEFQLGKFTFLMKHGKVFLKKDNTILSILRLNTDHVEVEITNYITSGNYTSIKLFDDWDNPSLVSTTYSKFKKDLFYNAIHKYELGYSRNFFSSNEFLLPDQLDDKITNREIQFGNIQVQFNVKKESFIIGEMKGSFGKGIITLSDDTKMAIHVERDRVNFLIAGKVPLDKIKPIFEKKSEELCFFINDGDTQCIFLSDMQYIAEAVNMLMHVLTGPDPRSYYPAPPTPDLPFKETSDPFTSYFVFTQDEDGAHYANWEDTIYFFKYDDKSMTYEEAIKVRDYIIDYLMNYQGSDFAYNYAKFMEGKMKDMPKYTLEEFKKALYRIRRFELWEYMGEKILN